MPRKNYLPLLVLTLLILPAASPLFQPTLTRSADGLLHLYRVVALDHALNRGVFFPRWLPDLAYGYGLPLFVFYAPLAYYLTEGLHLAGLGTIPALNGSFVLAIWISGLGVYLLVRDLFGLRAGMLAAAAYVYAPYPLYNIMGRGSLPIAWAGAIFPLVFWAFTRLIRTGRPRYLPLSAFLLGLALLTHNISSLVYLPLLLFYVALSLYFRAKDSTAYYRTGLGLALGIGLAAFFLIPAVLEKQFVQIERVITPPDFDYHDNFVPFAELFRLPPPANTGLLNPDPPLTPGPVQMMLAALGLVGLIYRRNRPDPAPLLFAWVGLGIILFMALPLSVGVWERLPLIAFVQQPHRLLSLAAFLLALLAGWLIAALPERFRTGATLIGLSLIFAAAIPLLYPRYAPPPDPTLPGMIAYEQATGAIGTTSFGEYLPHWVEQVPREPPETRFDPAYLPAGTELEAATYGFNRADLTLDSPQPFQAVFHTFYFPGWQAAVDGEPAPIGPVSERGLIGVSLPAGRHRLQLRFRETPIRLAADILSALSLILIAAYGLYTAGPGKKSNARPEAVPRSALYALLILGLLFIGLKAAYLDRYDNPFKRVFDGNHVDAAKVSRRVNFGDQINLLGYDLDRRTTTFERSFALTAYWQARHPLAVDYSSLLHLVDDGGHLYAGQDNLHPGGLPSSRWEPWGFVRDPHTLSIPPGTPPGDYQLALGLYHPATWQRLPTGEPDRADVIAVPVRVVKANRPPTLAELEIAWPVQRNLGPDLRLLGASPEQTELRRNDLWRVALFWETIRAPIEQNYQIQLQLRAGQTIAAEQTGQPSYGRYPTRRWTVGERVRDNHALWIPPDLEPDRYQLWIQLIAENGQPVGPPILLGQTR